MFEVVAIVWKNTKGRYTIVLVNCVIFLDNLIRGASKHFFLFLLQNICCGYSFELPWQGVSSEYQHIFSSRNKNNIQNSI